MQVFWYIRCAGQVVTDVSNNHAAFIVKVKQSPKSIIMYSYPGLLWLRGRMQHIILKCKEPLTHQKTTQLLGSVV